MERNDKTLERFLIAQEHYYKIAKSELIKGKKESCWMWYIFPQLCALGRSDTSNYYGISNDVEALEYYNHPVLGKRLVELCHILLKLEENDASKIFGDTDSMKLRSCMTLFYLTSKNQVFMDVINKFYAGEIDKKTADFLRIMKVYG